MIEITKRRSIRKYKSASVGDDLIKKLIESAMLAPSGDNTQPWHFVIIDKKDMIKKIAEVAHNQKWISSVPLIIACVADVHTRIKDTENLAIDEYSNFFEVKQIIRDTAIAVEHMVLEAVSLGLGSCWVSWYKQKDIKNLLHIPDDKFVVTLLTLGFADEDPKPRPRKKIEEIIHKDEW